MIKWDFCFDSESQIPSYAKIMNLLSLVRMDCMSIILVSIIVGFYIGNLQKLHSIKSFHLLVNLQAFSILAKSPALSGSSLKPKLHLFKNQ